MKDEPVDVLDERGKKTGLVLMKSEAHAKSLWHGVIHIWLYNSKGEVLMQKRSPQKIISPNAWDVAAGGHITAGEVPKGAAVKEAGEEISLKISKDELKFIGRRKFTHQMEGWKNQLFISSYILKKDVNASGLKLEVEEVSGVKWIKLDELEKMLNDPSEEEDFIPDIRVDCNAALAEIRRALNKKEQE